MQTSESLLNDNLKRDLSFRVILPAVLLLHGFLILYAAWIGPTSLQRKVAPPPPRFVVQTVDITPRSAPIAISSPHQHVPVIKQEPAPQPANVEKSVSEPMPTPKPASNQVETKKVAEVKKVAALPAPPKPQKTAPAKPKEVKKTAAPPKPDAKPALKETKKIADSEAQKKAATEETAERTRQQQLLAQAQERIAKIGKSSDKVSATKLPETVAVANPRGVSSLQVDALPTVSAVGGEVMSSRQVGYRDEIAGRLKLLLRLPEYGEVKLKLTLDKTGKVVKVVIVSAESAANRKYVEKALPGMTFPSFGTNFGSAAEYEFPITLTSEL